MTSDDRDSLPPTEEGESRSLPFSDSDPQASPDPDKASEMTPDQAPEARPRRPRWVEWTVLAAVTLLVALGVKNYVAQAFVIPSPSMEPGLVKGDRIMVNKLAGPVQRGDVVVFEDPGGWLDEAPSTNPLTSLLGKVGLYPTTGHLVKRVIGVAGDTVVCCDDQGRLSVNGTPIDESGFLSDDPGRACDGAMRGCDWTAGPVPQGTVFVMGDNRSNTRDSTRWLCVGGATDCVDQNAYVDTSLIVGTVWGVVWPVNRWTRLDRPAVFGTIR